MSTRRLVSMALILVVAALAGEGLFAMDGFPGYAAAGDPNGTNKGYICLYDATSLAIAGIAFVGLNSNFGRAAFDAAVAAVAASPARYMIVHTAACPNDTAGAGPSFDCGEALAVVIMS